MINPSRKYFALLFILAIVLIFAIFFFRSEMHQIDTGSSRISKIDTSSEYPCTGNTTPTRTYIDDISGYSLTIPVSYLIATSSNTLQINKYKCWDYSKGPAPETLIVHVETQISSIKYTDPLRYVRSKYTTINYQTVEIHPATIGDLSGAEVLLYSPGEEGYLDERLLVFIKNSSIYSISYGHRDDQDYKKIAESFKFIGR